MVLKIKQRWNRTEKSRSWPEQAQALAFIAWRLAQQRAIHLHGQQFIYTDDAQRLAVIAEYLYFLIACVDRRVYRQIADAERTTLIVHLAQTLAQYMQDNGQDLLGTGDYARPFLNNLNQRSHEYAALPWDVDGPTYAVLRHLGYQIQHLMGNDAQNRWVIDQVMEQDGAALYHPIIQAVDALRASAPS